MNWISGKVKSVFVCQLKNPGAGTTYKKGYSGHKKFDIDNLSGLIRVLEGYCASDRFIVASLRDKQDNEFSSLSGKAGEVIKQLKSYLK